LFLVWKITGILERCKMREVSADGRERLLRGIRKEVEMVGVGRGQRGERKEMERERERERVDTSAVSKGGGEQREGEGEGLGVKGDMGLFVSYNC
jgi:hypothetical protein